VVPLAALVAPLAWRQPRGDFDGVGEVAGVHRSEPGCQHRHRFRALSENAANDALCRCLRQLLQGLVNLPQALDAHLHGPVSVSARATASISSATRRPSAASRTAVMLYSRPS